MGNTTTVDEEGRWEVRFVDPLVVCARELRGPERAGMVWDEVPPVPFVESLEERVPGAFLVHRLMSEGECKRWIDLSEELGYEDAPLRNMDSTHTRDDYNKAIRNAKRVVLKAPEAYLLPLEHRLAPHRPAQVRLGPALWRPHPSRPLHRTLRFNRYDDGHYFRPHLDAGFAGAPGERTVFTFVLYLNEGFQGGETVFFPGNRRRLHLPPVEGAELRVVPRTGSALVFFQDGEKNFLHEGATVLGDVPKYILRSDLRYVRVPDELEKEEEESVVDSILNAGKAVLDSVMG
eukprot:TRINITY_DN14081_c0_g1_i2.p1 TRINITY_DN14081_c0_g1~~TRINITY_DN14081_c0_g1_i2.p1  ORF type:complete len:290 (-),score=51.08 TRINITY_DN14081_c0_g1_i2:201-1070(-)